MSILSKPSPTALAAVSYITIGALTGIWSGIWYAYLRHSPPENDFTWYCCYGFLLTGLTLFVIGLMIGRIGRSARHAELPPEEVTAAVVKADQEAAANAPVIAPIDPAGAAVVSNGQTVVPPKPVTIASPPKYP
jgi:hypothetical protein